MYAILSGYKYFEDRKTKDILLSVGSITLAMMFKSNYLIVFVAMIIFILFDIILNKHYRSFILFLVLVPAYLLQALFQIT